MELNWSLCIICQRHTGECLKYPSDNPVSSTNTAGPCQVFLDKVASVLKKLQITLLVTMLAGTKIVETNLVSLKCKETCL